jgi:TPR repeat protein
MDHSKQATGKKDVPIPIHILELTVDYNINKIATILAPILEISESTARIIGKFVYPDDSEFLSDDLSDDQRDQKKKRKETVIDILSEATDHELRYQSLAAFRLFNRVAEMTDSSDSFHVREYLKFWHVTTTEEKLIEMLEFGVLFGSAVAMYLLHQYLKSKNADRSGDLLIRSAYTGYTLSYYKLGRFYISHGLGVHIPKDKPKGLDILKKLAEEINDSDLLTNIGCYLFRGQGCVPNPMKAKEYWKRAADQNNMTAIYYLGRGFDKGYFGIIDKKEAVKWYTIAADNENLNAISALIELYLTPGPMYDEAHAYGWSYTRAKIYEKSRLREKEPNKMSTVEFNTSMIATLLENIVNLPKTVTTIVGRYTYPDDSDFESRRFYRPPKEFEKTPTCKLRQAIDYELGKGGGKDANCIEAYRSFSCVAESKSPDRPHVREYLKLWYPTKNRAMLHVMLEHIISVSSSAAVAMHILFCITEAVDLDKERVANLIIKSAHLGYTPARYELARMYIYGETIIPRDQKKGFELMKAVAEETQDPLALNSLGYFLDQGKGCIQNLISARQYYQRASRLGNMSAAYNLACCYDDSKDYFEKPDGKAIFTAVEFYEYVAKNANHLKAMKRLVSLYSDKSSAVYNEKAALFWKEKLREKSEI